MNTNRYPAYAAALLVGGAIAIWAGLPPFLLLILVACPLMMFFMMRGMHDDQSGHSHDGRHDSTPPDVNDSRGSHQHFDRP